MASDVAELVQTLSDPAPVGQLSRDSLNEAIERDPPDQGQGRTELAPRTTTDDEGRVAFRPTLNAGSLPALEPLQEYGELFYKLASDQNNLDPSGNLDGPSVYFSNSPASPTRLDPSQRLQRPPPGPEMVENVQPFREDAEVATRDVAVPNKRFSISTGGRHSNVLTGPIQMSLRQYIGSGPGALAFKRHEYNPDIQTRLPGYPRMSLQTRLRALKARTGSDQNVLHGFAQRSLFPFYSVFIFFFFLAILIVISISLRLP